MKKFLYIVIASTRKKRTQSRIIVILKGALNNRFKQILKQSFLFSCSHSNDHNNHCFKWEFIKRKIVSCYIFQGRSRDSVGKNFLIA